MDSLQRESSLACPDILLLNHSIALVVAALISIPVTSTLQKALTVQGTGCNTPDDLVKAYEKLFRAMKIILEPYGMNVNIEVGSLLDPEYDYPPIILTLSGLVAKSKSYIDITAAVLEAGDLYEPKKILYNLISEITKVAEATKNEINDIEAAIRVYKGMADGMDNKELNPDDIIKEQLR